MKEIEISIKIRHYQLEELPEEERELVSKSCSTALMESIV